MQNTYLAVEGQEGHFDTFQECFFQDVISGRGQLGQDHKEDRLMVDVSS